MNLYQLEELQTLLKPVLEFVAWCELSGKTFGDGEPISVGCVGPPGKPALTMGDLRKVAALMNPQQPEVKT